MKKIVRMTAASYRYLGGENDAGLMLNEIWFNQNILPKAFEKVRSTEGMPDQIKFSIFDHEGDEYQFVAERQKHLGEGNYYFLNVTIPRFEIPARH
ncbi:hypothetical protein GFC29_3828 (plasmid) [Anoxybacillus sp. B7M1]|uniref:hypothetical protein n=1 Tax=Anoxybacillus sp. B7M1 TaxID=1490057 RepID=UPI0005CCE49D|nr:hypothetical protein [Anoxybacillus sp. B7M1]ANB66175.1 hypothetical protein GFC29_3828 [Anoxybacillus sp. B7M1]